MEYLKKVFFTQNEFIFLIDEINVLFTFLSGKKTPKYILKFLVDAEKEIKAGTNYLTKNTIVTIYSLMSGLKNYFDYNLITVRSFLIVKSILSKI